MQDFQKQGLIKITSAIVIILVFISIYYSSYQNFQHIESLRKICCKARSILAIADMIDIQAENIFRNLLIREDFNSTNRFKSAFKERLVNFLNCLNESLKVRILLSEQIEKENDTYSCFLLCFRIERDSFYAKVCRIFEFTIRNGSVIHAYSERVSPKL